MICLLLSLFAHIYQPGWTGANERTFLAVKPDGVQRKLVGEIVRRFEKRGFKLVGLKLVKASEDVLREHYWDLRNKPFFSRLISYMSSGPVVAMVWQGLDVVKTARKMLGETNPADSLPGTIRGDFCVEVGKVKLRSFTSVKLFFQQHYSAKTISVHRGNHNETGTRKLGKILNHAVGNGCQRESLTSESS
ncbi:nucleoside diphosphate kinase 3 isoform X2 [Nothobranchius furzeri]|uniref:nucleoside diphosphate kinase 3 isoform X2 n=1 Tax=Nothobranchius furzeri TaxID=105023 RepID=UPI00077D5BEF|nr:nucleoside diphosphate kinase 3 isoform X2 [Nothobranchius furzeri]